MFDLKREVDAWSKKSYAGPCRDKAATLDELKDHVYCEIERLEAGGATREEAFRMATTELDGSAEKAGEKRGCRTRSAGRKANAIVWASVMIASSLLLVASGDHKVSSYLLLSGFMPAYMASDRILARNLPTAGNGGSLP